MSHLTTHVLDTSSGKPAADIRVVLRRTENSDVLADATTNTDSRLEKPLLEGGALTPGNYEITFHVGNYFRARGVDLAGPTFFDVVPVRFSVASGRNYRLPLQISPYGYSTYRES
jgi:5-hydroxyisourate hydrolase